MGGIVTASGGLENHSFLIQEGLPRFMLRRFSSIFFSWRRSIGGVLLFVFGGYNGTVLNDVWYSLGI